MKKKPIKQEDIPMEALQVWAQSASGIPVGSKRMEEINLIIEKYPQHFPWEAKYRSIPQNVHESYLNERWAIIESETEKYRKENNGGGIYLTTNRSSPVYRPLLLSEEDAVTVFRNAQNNKERLEKEREKKEKKAKALWDKHYKPYGLKYRQ